MGQGSMEIPGEEKETKDQAMLHPMPQARLPIRILQLKLLPIKQLLIVPLWQVVAHNRR
jgi:hypothetical protein